MSRMSVEKDYFEWLYNLVCEGRYEKPNSYRKLLKYLHDTEFTYRLRHDSDRAQDGVDLRRRFALQNDEYYYDYTIRSLDGPCSVLEMMIALAIRCEETIMADPQVGDRTGQWFWKMIHNLGLGSMLDYRFDEEYVEQVVITFLNRKYEPNGRGGLFTIRGCDSDLRKVEIWRQLCWYLDSIT